MSKVYPRKAPGYNEQCLTAVARALPEDDDYRHTIEANLKSGENNTLEEFSHGMLDVPVLCCLADYETTHPILRLDEFRLNGGDSGLAKLFLDTERRYLLDKPIAMFVRLSDPARLNVVLHRLNMFRTSWDPAVLHMIRPEGVPVFVERRTTFCRLLASIGLWSLGRPGRIVPFDDEAIDDLRRVDPQDLYETAVRVADRWGYRRTRAITFRDLSDGEFIRKVMEMQMAGRIERGDWS